MRQYRCPVCGQKTDKKQCSSCGWDFTKDITKGFLLAQMSRAACRAYMQELQAQKKNYAGIQNADFYNYHKREEDLDFQDDQDFQESFVSNEYQEDFKKVPRRKLGKFFKQRMAIAISAALIIGAAGYGYFSAKDAVAEAEGQKIETSGSVGAEMDSVDEYFKGKIPVVAISADYPPYAYDNDQGSVGGADIDILKEVLVEDGTDVMKIEDVSFGQLSRMLGSGEADIAAGGITPTPERDQAMDFSDVYASAQIVIVMPENLTMTSVEEMDGSGVLGVLQNSLAQDCSEQYGYEIMVYEDRERMWKDLASGLLDGVVDDCIWVQQYMDIYGGYKILDGILAAEDYVFAVSEGNQGLLAKINAGIKRLKDTGRIDEIIEEHVGLGLQKHMM